MKLKDFLKSNQAKAVYWQMFNGLLSLLIAYITQSNYAIVPVLLPFLNYITKEINRNK